MALDALLIGWMCFRRVVGGWGWGVGWGRVDRKYCDRRDKVLRREEKREEKRREKAEADFWSSRRLVVREGLLL